MRSETSGLGLYSVMLFPAVQHWSTQALDHLFATSILLKIHSESVKRPNVLTVLTLCHAAFLVEYSRLVCLFTIGWGSVKQADTGKLNDVFNIPQKQQLKQWHDRCFANGQFARNGGY